MYVVDALLAQQVCLQQAVDGCVAEMWVWVAGVVLLHALQTCKVLRSHMQAVAEGCHKFNL